MNDFIVRHPFGKGETLVQFQSAAPQNGHFLNTISAVAGRTEREDDIANRGISVDFVRRMFRDDFTMAGRIDGNGTRIDSLTDARRLKRREPSKREEHRSHRPCRQVGMPHGEDWQEPTR